MKTIASVPITKQDIDTVLDQMEIKTGKNINYRAVALRLVEDLSDRFGEQMRYVIEDMEASGELWRNVDGDSE